MATLQVNDMDDGLYRALAACAAQENRSISEEVVVLIQDFLARPCPSSQAATEAFLAMAGTWADDRSAEEIITELREQRCGGRRLGAKDAVLD